MTFLPTYQESFLRYTTLDASIHESLVLPVGPLLPVLRVRPVKPKPAKPAWRPDWLTGGRANGLPSKPTEIFDCFDSEIWNSRPDWARLPRPQKQLHRQNTGSPPRLGADQV